IEARDNQTAVACVLNRKRLRDGGADGCRAEAETVTASQLCVSRKDANLRRGHSAAQIDVERALIGIVAQNMQSTAERAKGGCVELHNECREVGWVKRRGRQVLHERKSSRQ